MPTNENDRNVNLRFAELPLKVQAVHARHPHVEDKAGRSIAALRQHKVLCGSESFRAKAD